MARPDHSSSMKPDMKQRRRTGRTATWLAGWLGLACGLLTARADVRLPALFSDHLVLQRDMEVPVWGWAEPGEPVTVSVAGQTRKTQANSRGRWLVRFPTMAATRDPLRLSVQGKNSLIVRDGLVGDVWLCAGPGGGFQRGKEGAGAMPLVLVRETPHRPAVGHLQIALGALQRLDVRFLIHAQHQGILRRMKI